MSDFSWIIYRRNTSASAGQWEYMEVPTEDLRTQKPDDFAEQYLESRYDGHSEHFRGYEWHEIPAPPPIHLVALIEGHRRSLIAIQRTLERHETLLKEGPVYAAD